MTTSQLSPFHFISHHADVSTYFSRVEKLQKWGHHCLNPTSKLDYAADATATLLILQHKLFDRNFNTQMCAIENSVHTHTYTHQHHHTYTYICQRNKASENDSATQNAAYRSTFLEISQFFGWYLISEDIESEIVVFLIFQKAWQMCACVSVNFVKLKPRHTHMYTIYSNRIDRKSYCNIWNSVPLYLMRYIYFSHVFIFRSRNSTHFSVSLLHFFSSFCLRNS